MGRKKWNALSTEEKKKFSNKLLESWDKFSKVKDKLTDQLDVFEAFTDEAKYLFECDLICTTCTVDDVKNCLYNFRQANFYMLTKIKMWEEGLDKFIEGLDGYMQTLLRILNYQIDDEIKEEEQLKENPKKPDILIYS